MAGSRQGMTFDGLREDLARGRFSPVYLFHGEEDFLLGEAVEVVVATALSPADRSFNLDILYGNDLDARTAISHASTFPMNTDRRVVIVRDADKLAGAELLATYAEHPSPTTSLILIASKPDFRKRPYNVLKTASAVVEFKKLYENQIPGWIEHRVKQQEHEIDPSGNRLLAEYVGTSLREIQNELEKLYVYAWPRKQITVDDVQAVSGISKEFSIFELQRTMGDKDLGRSLEILGRMLDGGQSPIKITVMLAHYYIALRKLIDLRRKEPAIQASALGIKPYFLREYQAALDNYSEQELDEALLAITRADEQLKTTSYEAKQILQFMAAAILSNVEIRELS